MSPLTDIQKRRFNLDADHGTSLPVWRPSNCPVSVAEINALRYPARPPMPCLSLGNAVQDRFLVNLS